MTRTATRLPPSQDTEHARVAAPPWFAGPAQAVLALQRAAGNSSVTRILQRQPDGRLPAPSAAAAVPARIKGMQHEFHDLMREANEIVNGTKFHYDSLAQQPVFIRCNLPAGWFSARLCACAWVVSRS